MENKQQWGSLILRLVLGITFFVHGLAKFQMGLGNVAGFFQSLGLPGPLGYLVAVLELVGGIALIVGLATRIFSAALAVIMIGAIFTVKLQAGFMGAPGKNGYEFDLALLAMALYFVFAGSDALSVDHLFKRKKANES
ncbi:DoxX family protein [Thermoflavimicrobium dichotomicum]|uniref:Uncharacterized membrane protein YphA, DoxX/SURF4 family n=1 Tax=Thermoflavimicrobium dichotomicum TaxID=46223 RepID=A0A1I3UTI6_9BACL|nr:DoxX family protein [Thermoflavimicrobium dichotomicum]SFJ86310.1 Uncharacterized membrane protein YphA, DoxX/SURF4 family [Thermoflavimicrobium dichotomicum]